MDLYIDTYITDTPLLGSSKPFAKIFKELSEYRSTNILYKNTSKIDIFLFTLLSYKFIEHDNVYINFNCEDGSKESNLISLIESIYPTAIVNNKRSDSVKLWFDRIRQVAVDDWVFFSPNNDHPYIGTNRFDFSSLVAVANNYRVKFTDSVVMINYSHFFEGIASSRFLGRFYGYYGEPSQIISETDEYIITINNYLKIDSLSVFHWFDLLSLFEISINEKKRVVRLEDLPIYMTKFKKSIIIYPKIEICRHFDGYLHTKLLSTQPIDFSIASPLFIPNKINHNLAPTKIHPDLPRVLDFYHITNNEYNEYFRISGESRAYRAGTISILDFFNLLKTKLRVIIQKYVTSISK